MQEIQREIRDHYALNTFPPPSDSCLLKSFNPTQLTDQEMEGISKCAYTLGNGSVPPSKGPPDAQYSESVNLHTELQNLDAEVSRVQALLKSLVDKRAHIKRKLNNLASPMLRLPPEISSEIFTFYLRRNRYLAPDSPFISSSPFLLGKICWSWRELAWSLPSLWSSVSMDRWGDTPALYATLLDEYLSRSGSRPLSICIRDFGDGETDKTAMLDIMGTIARFSERWCHVDFNLSLSCYEALRHVQGRVPILRDILLCLQGPTSGFERLERLEMFSIAPQLRVVNSMNFRPGTLTVPSAQLTTFYTNTCNAEDCLQSLRASPRLINADFALSNIPGSVSQVTAPCLQSLTLRASDSLPVSSFLDNLSIPAAHQLVFVSLDYWMVPFPCMSLVSLVTRSRCVLQSLSLTAFELADDGIFHCLQVIPSLTELSLSCPSPGLSHRFISMLNPLISPTLMPGLVSTPLLPNLQILKFSGHILLDCAGLLAMLSVRWRNPLSCPDNDHHPIARLHSATIKVKESVVTIRPPPIASLRQLVEEGMQISLVVNDSTWI